MTICRTNVSISPFVSHKSVVVVVDDRQSRGGIEGDEERYSQSCSEMLDPTVLRVVISNLENAL
jgi:hypothetical protein